MTMWLSRNANCKKTNEGLSSECPAFSFSSSNPSSSLLYLRSTTSLSFIPLSYYSPTMFMLRNGIFMRNPTVCPSS